jgi:hypothetical protein
MSAISSKAFVLAKDDEPGEFGRGRDQQVWHCRCPVMAVIAALNAEAAGATTCDQRSAARAATSWSISSVVL